MIVTFRSAWMKLPDDHIEGLAPPSCQIEKGLYNCIALLFSPPQFPFRGKNHELGAKKGQLLFPPGIEPGTFRVLGERDNRYTMETWMDSNYRQVLLNKKTNLQGKKKNHLAAVGFEPTPPGRLEPKSSALDHSATLPTTRNASGVIFHQIVSD